MGFILSMDKTLFICILMLLSFASCKKEEENKRLELDQFNRISVIIDDELWNGEVGDSLRNKFATPTIGLPQEEPMFTLNQYPLKLMEGYMANSRNIIIIKKGNKSQFKIVKNEFLKPQIVVHVSGSTVKEIIDSLKTKDSIIISNVKKQEIALFQQEILKDSLRTTESLEKKFGITLTIPKKYELVLKGKRFLWYKKQITSGSLSLIVYQIPINKYPLKKFSLDNVIEVRNLIGKKYIHGNRWGTYMITDESYTPSFSKEFSKNLFVYETRGGWELTNEYMNGPFINFGFVDWENKRILFLEGFCYAPSKQKRDFLFELESIIKSIKFENRDNAKMANKKI